MPFSVTYEAIVESDARRKDIRPTGLMTMERKVAWFVASRDPFKWYIIILLRPLSDSCWGEQRGMGNIGMGWPYSSGSYPWVRCYEKKGCFCMIRVMTDPAMFFFVIHNGKFARTDQTLMSTPPFCPTGDHPTHGCSTKVGEWKHCLKKRGASVGPLDSLSVTPAGATHIYFQPRKKMAEVEIPKEKGKECEIERQDCLPKVNQTLSSIGLKWFQMLKINMGVMSWGTGRL